LVPGGVFLSNYGATVVEDATGRWVQGEKVDDLGIY